MDSEYSRRPVTLLLLLPSHGDDDIEFYIEGGSGNLKLYINDLTPHSHIASSSVIDTNFHHVVVTRNGNEIKFFIDGTQNGTTGSIPEQSHITILVFI